MNARGDIERLAALVRARSDEVAQAVSGGALADWLYQHWYLTPVEGFPPETEPPPHDSLDAALSAITDDAAPWMSDWIALSVGEGGACLAGRGTTQRLAQVGRYASLDRPGLPVVPGERLALPQLLSWLDTATGQWAAQSDAVPVAPLVRLYVNIGSEDVGVAVATLTQWLAKNNISFSMKCPGLATNFCRADALVVYLADRDWPSLEAGARSCVAELGPIVRAGRPPLTQQLLPGLAFAEDPGDGQSFGQNRCALFAPHVAAALVDGRDLDEAMMAALRAARIEPDAPWRRPV